MCTCSTCTVSTRYAMFALFTITLGQASYEVLYGEYMVRAGRGKEPPDKSTAAIMESILQVRTGELICTHTTFRWRQSPGDVPSCEQGTFSVFHAFKPCADVICVILEIFSLP